MVSKSKKVKIIGGGSMYKNNIILKATLIVAIFVAMSFAQPLLVENFNYTANSPLTSNGWTAHSGIGSNPILVYSPGLTYTGYAGSGIGNAAKVDTAGEDVNRTFAPQTSGPVYTAFMIRVMKATTAGDYFFHLSIDSLNTYYFNMRTHIKRDASNNVAIGIGKTTRDTSFSGFSYALNTTYLVVLKWQINAGDSNDQLSMFVLSSGVPGTEPTSPTIGPVSPAISDPPSIGSVALRQGSAANAPRVIIDGIRVATSWAGAVSGIEENQPINQLANNNLVIYPNPIRAGSYNITLSNVEHYKGVKIYDAIGNLVKTLPTSGASHLSWDARNDAGNLVTPGIYIVVLETENISQTAKVLVTK